MMPVVFANCKMHNLIQKAREIINKLFTLSPEDNEIVLTVTCQII